MSSYRSNNTINLEEKAAAKEKKENQRRHPSPVTRHHFYPLAAKNKIMNNE